MRTVVEKTPSHLHISLLLFFAGLIEFLLSINIVICNLSVAILAVCSTLYVAVTLLPIFYHYCPYRTPFSYLLGGLADHLEFRTLSSRHLSPSPHISGSRDGAIEGSSARDTRDEDAPRQTLETLLGSGDLEDFVDGIPGYLLEHGASAIIMQWFLSDKDIGFGTRITQPPRLSATKMRLKSSREPFYVLVLPGPCLSIVGNQKNLKSEIGLTMKFLQARNVGTVHPDEAWSVHTTQYIYHSCT